MSLLLSLTLLLPIIDTACATSVDDSIVIGIQSTKTLTIRPFEPLERDMLSVYNLVYESLIRIDDGYMPQGCLAESWEQSSNGKTWTFHLRTDVSFSDGTPLTAQDVVASAQYILDKANDEASSDPGFYFNLKYFINSISASDDHTVVIKAKRKYYGLLYELTFPVVPASQVSSDSPLGTGPYIISDFAAGDYMHLQANTGWWQAQPRVREIMLSFHDTARAVIESYEYARVDAVFTRSTAGAQYKSGTSSLSISYRTSQLECLYMNNNSSELSEEARKAIRYVIDKEKIISNAYLGPAQETNFPFYPGTWMYNESLDSMFTKNVDEAKRLLSAAGWEDSDENGILDRINSKGEQANLHLRFYYYEEPDNDVRAEAARIIADSLEEIGISCTLEAMTMANLKEKLSAGSFDLALVSFSMDTCPDPGFLLMSGNTGNYNRYKNQKMTEMCEELRDETSYEGFRQKLMSIQEKFANDCPFVCLYFRKGCVITRYMYTAARDVREYELLRGIESF